MATLRRTYCLDLVADKQHVVLLAQCLNLGKVAVGRDDDTCFTLDRLQENRGGLFSVQFECLLEVLDNTVSITAGLVLSDEISGEMRT